MEFSEVHDVPAYGQIVMATTGNHTSTFAGTLGGTAMTLFATIDPGDVVRSTVLAGIGAVVSFAVSLALKKLVRRWSQ